MENNLSNFHTIAEAVRIEIEDNNVFLVFKITDEKFKKTIRTDWVKDIQLQIIGRELVESNE